MKENNHVCPVERAGALDLKIRKLIHNPQKMFAGLLKKDMKVVDIGCGPGFFTIEIAKMVGKNGKVIAADLQQGMLDRIKKKIENTDLEDIITLHQTKSDEIGVKERVDFALAFYMVHEVPDKNKMLNEVYSILNKNGLFYISEPKFHVKMKDFNAMIDKALKIGFEKHNTPGLTMSHTVVLRKN